MQQHCSIGETKRGKSLTIIFIQFNVKIDFSAGMHIEGVEYRSVTAKRKLRVGTLCFHFRLTNRDVLKTRSLS